MRYNIYVEHPTDIYLAYKAANQWLHDRKKYPDTKIMGYTYNEAGTIRKVTLKQNKSSVSVWVMYKE